ncbi:hypothetical protein [Streptomyces hesseae]|uniref:Uncharacterized protein n=1 Tax=Streptomyces hesseae TaxID=3075519 RepID=A0ABU2SJV6_9ACTN|nr:hypothetical protein [Streptomyces sp. DSM 40473]MDT0449256.1 hypothetical protein [Streptomyces sp. DSM 40473]
MRKSLAGGWVGRSVVELERAGGGARQHDEGVFRVEGVAVVAVGTKYDEITTPWQSTFMTAGPGATVRNITLQEGCFVDFSAHLSMSYSPRAIGLVKRALDPSAPAAPCVPRAPAF